MVALPAFDEAKEGFPGVPGKANNWADFRYSGIAHQYGFAMRGNLYAGAVSDARARLPKTKAFWFFTAFFHSPTHPPFSSNMIQGVPPTTLSSRRDDIAGRFRVGGG